MSETIKIDEVLISLAKERPIFHSEADFKHSLACKLQQKFPCVDVFIEFPVELKRRVYIDIWLEYKNKSKLIAIELKYRSKRVETHIRDMCYNLKDHGAQDEGRYGFVNDIKRLEKLASEYKDKNFTGYAILLTNDRTYWSQPDNSNSSGAADSAFRLHEGRILEGRLKWGNSQQERKIELEKNILSGGQIIQL